MSILDEEMIGLAKIKIKETSSEPHGPKYYPFEKQPEVIEFYDKKYKDKWVRVYSKKWVYAAAAASDLIHAKAKKSVKLGERLKNEQLILLGEKLYCSMGDYKDSKNLCINSHKILLAIQSRNKADDSIKSAEMLAKQDIAAKEAEIEATKQQQRALLAEQKIHNEKETQLAFQEKTADDEKAKLKLLVEERNEKISGTFKKIGIPDYLISATLGYI